MKKLSFMFFAVALFCANAEDVYWISNTSGSWNDGANWSSGVVPNKDGCKVFVTNETSVTITIPANVRVGSIEFSGADHIITNSSGYLCFDNANSDKSMPNY